MLKTFKGFPQWLRIVLLAIPAVNWVVEIILRVSALIEKKCLENVLMLICVILPFGVIVGWVDLVLTEVLKKGFLLMK